MRVIRLEGLLAVDEVVELPHRQIACAQQFLRIPRETGGVHQALTVGEAGGNRHPVAEGTPFEGEKAYGPGLLGEHRDPDSGSKPAGGDGELGGQEGVCQ